MDIINGELVDTYGGDYTFQYVSSEIEDGEVVFYEEFMGAKPRDKERVYDQEQIAEYMAIYERLNNEVSE